MTTDPTEFDVGALYAAMDAQRAERGMTWAQVSKAMGGVAPSTITGMTAKGSVEGDGVLRMLCWLNRPPEAFVPALAASVDLRRCALPPLNPSEELRFDTPKLYAALDAERVDRRMTWQQVASEIGGFSAGMLTRMAREGRVGFPRVMRLMRWLGRSAVEFTRVTNW